MIISLKSTAWAELKRSADKKPKMAAAKRAQRRTLMP